MRDINFRGKTLDGKWVHGFYASVKRYEFIEDRINEHHYIITREGNEEVEPETVGQYTGLSDKNGKEIFEGDVVKRPFLSGYVNSEVFWSEHKLAWMYDRLTTDYLWRLKDDCEIVGNIYDNPELLK